MNQISILNDVKPEYYFYTKDGRIVKNLSELNSAIKKMDDATFHHHVNPERHDFANWVYNVHKEKELADKLRKAFTKYEILKLIEARIGELKKRKLRVRKEEKKLIEAIKHPEKRARYEEQKNVFDRLSNLYDDVHLSTYFDIVVFLSGAVIGIIIGIILGRFT